MTGIFHKPDPSTSAAELVRRVEAAPTQTRRLFFCVGCRRELPRAGTYCEPCGDEQAATWKRARLQLAFDSVPERYREATFSQHAFVARCVRDTNAIGKAIKAASDRAERVTLLGQAGAGKTTLAAAIFHFELEHATHSGEGPGHFDAVSRARWIAAVDLASSRRNTSLGSESAMVLAAISCPMLVLDDLGMNKESFADPTIDVLDARFRAQRRTIVTTGLDRAAIANRYGGGIERRLFEEAAVIEVRA